MDIPGYKVRKFKIILLLCLLILICRIQVCHVRGYQKILNDNYAKVNIYRRLANNLKIKIKTNWHVVESNCILYWGHRDMFETLHFNINKIIVAFPESA